MTSLKTHCCIIICLFIGLTFFSCSSDVDYTPPAGSTDTAITHYSFGKMTIDGKTHEYDLSICGEGKVQGFAVEDHQIDIHNIKRLVTGEIKTVIIGIGYSSMANLTSDTLRFVEKLKAKGIEVHVMSTGKAVNLFNSLSKNGLLAFFHLTC